MKGHLTSYVGLFQPQPSDAPSVDSVEIPLIQRDYAQGRQGASVQEIRTNFLEVLLNAIAGGEPVGLDFVYGRVEGKTFHPLDGQQRLTTLFLLHWYLASAADRLSADEPWVRFSYATRPSARLFCQRLAANSLPQDVEIPSAWITDQAWYLYVWRTDPTIQSMLVVIDAIHDEVHRLHPDLNAQAAWEHLTDATSPAVSFYLLPLDDMESDEDLYIKMNSRGKPLTAFENFKAHFEQDIKYSNRAEDFAHKIDGAWSDLLWPFHGGDFIVDDEFISYICYVTEICELREGRLGSGLLGQRARTIFGCGNDRSAEHLGFLFDSFDKWENHKHLKSTFSSTFSNYLPGQEHYDWQKVALHGATNTNLFEECCRDFNIQRGGNRAFTLQQSLLLYAILLNLIHLTEDFPRRLRILRNLIAASEDEVRRDNMPALVKDVEAIIVNGDLHAVGKLSRNQAEDEHRKQRFLEDHPELTDVLYRLEDHPILRGTLSSFEFDSETFRQRAQAFEKAFADPTNWEGLTGALLATGNYQRRRPKSSAWQFGTGSTANAAVWRYLLTDAPRDSLTGTRTVLAEFLDEFAGCSSDPANHCNRVVHDWVSERERTQSFDWRYYLVNYPSMRKGATGIYYGEDGELGYSMCMLRTKQLNGKYRDPILLQVWQSSEVGPRVDDLWFTGYTASPRWLRLVNSRSGIRSIADGFALQGPEDESLQKLFADICERHEKISMNDDGVKLKIPQVERDGKFVDAVDRVVVGAALLKEFVEAGL